MLTTIAESLPLSQLFLAVMLHFVWQAALIVILVVTLRSFVRPHRFQLRYVMSVIGLFALMVAPLVTTGYYLTNGEALSALVPVIESGPVGVAGEGAVVESETWFGQLESRFQSVFFWFDGNRSVWLGAWMLGFTLLVVRLCISFGFCLKLRRSRKPLSPRLTRIANDIQKKLKMTRTVVVASSCEITQAVATGIIKPVVLIPTAWISQLPVTAIEAVLAHELAHIKRWDLWINLLQRFTETVFFFHPMVWWLSRMINTEREVCCDQLAIQTTGQPLEYVETLAHVAGNNEFKDFDFQFGSAFFGDKRMNLLRRARMILEPASVDAYTPLRTLTLLMCVALLVGYGSFAYSSTAPEPAINPLQENQEEEEIVVYLNEEGGDEEEIQLAMIVEDDDKNVKKKVHQHLAKFLHGSHDGEMDHKELAAQLRKLADHLEASGGKKAKAATRIKLAPNVTKKHVQRIKKDGQLMEIIVDGEGKHRVSPQIARKIKEHVGELHEFEIDVNEVKGKITPHIARRIKEHVGELHDLDVEVKDILHQHDGDHAIIVREVVVDQEGNAKASPRIQKRILKGNDVQIHASPRVQLKKNVNRTARVERRVIAEEKDGVIVTRVLSDDGPAHEVIGRVVLDGSAHKGKARKVQVHEHKGDFAFGHAHTSGSDDLGKVISDLKKEVQQLRKELNQLRSGENKIRYRFEEKKATPGQQRYQLRLRDGSAKSAPKTGTWITKGDLGKVELAGEHGVDFLLKSDADSDKKGGTVRYVLERNGTEYKVHDASKGGVKWVPIDKSKAGEAGRFIWVMEDGKKAGGALKKVDANTIKKGEFRFKTDVKPGDKKGTFRWIEKSSEKDSDKKENRFYFKHEDKKEDVKTDSNMLANFFYGSKDQDK